MPYLSEPGHVYVFLELQNAGGCGVELPAAGDAVSHWIAVITVGFPLVGGLCSALHDKVNKQKVADYGKISTSSHKSILAAWSFFFPPPAIMIGFHKGYSCKMPLELKSRIFKLGIMSVKL